MSNRLKLKKHKALILYYEASNVKFILWNKKAHYKNTVFSP